MSAAAPLEVKSLTKRFAIGNTFRRSHVHAVDDVSFELRPGTTRRARSPTRAPTRMNQITVSSIV